MRALIWIAAAALAACGQPVAEQAAADAAPVAEAQEAALAPLEPGESHLLMVCSTRTTNPRYIAFVPNVPHDHESHTLSDDAIAIQAQWVAHWEAQGERMRNPNGTTNAGCTIPFGTDEEVRARETESARAAGFTFVDWEPAR